MTTPTLFATGAEHPFQSKFQVQGNLSQESTITIPAGTGSQPSFTNVGLVRFQPGFSLLRLAITVDSLDSGATLRANIGYLYDGSTGEDPSAFYDRLDAGAGAPAFVPGDYVWPDSLPAFTSFTHLVGESFVATDHGYIVLQFGEADTDTEGDITCIADFTYDL